MEIDDHVEEVQVSSIPTPKVVKVNTKEFCQELYKELAEGKIWRTSKTLADKLNVDVVELDAFLRAQPVICSKASKEEGVFLYALIKRVEEIAKKEDENKVLARPLVNEEDRYALGCLHSAFMILEATLQKYAVKIHERNPEAFTNLVAGKDKLEAGIVLFGNKIKADFSKLPKV